MNGSVDDASQTEGIILSPSPALHLRLVDTAGGWGSGADGVAGGGGGAGRAEEQCEPSWGSWSIALGCTGY